MTLPSGAWFTAPGELTRTPVELLAGRQTTAGGAVTSLGGTFFTAPRDRLLVLQSIVLRLTVQAAAASETRIIRVRCMLVGGNGEDRGSVFEFRAPDVAGQGVFGQFGERGALAAGVAGDFCWSPDVQGVVVPTNISLRFQSFTGGGVPQVHTQEAQWIIAILPRGNVIS